MTDAVLIALSAGTLAAIALMVVAVVKTVRYHGWGKQKMAPPAVPWFWAGFAVVAATLACGILWSVT